LYRATPPTRDRNGAINASTVFAITLAVVAGLIFAWVAKKFVFDVKKPPEPKTDTVNVTVAATNILDKQEVQPSQIKTIKMSKEEYDRLANSEKYRKRTILTGNQPVGRTTKMPVNAEELFFLEQFEPLGWPESLEKRLAEGKRSVIVEVPAKEVMVQVYDRVDVLCTLANENAVFGPAGSSTTAVLAKNLQVVARFNTTRIAAQPPPGPTRTYTLEVDPWQGAIIELAKRINGSFALTVSKDPSSESEAVAASLSPSGDKAPEKNAYQIVAANFEKTKRVTVADLALLYGVEGPPDKVFRLEMYAGNAPGPVREYRNLPAAATGTEQPAPAPKPTVRPASTSPGSSGGKVSSSGSSGRTASTMLARNNFGFKPVEDPSTCKTCGKKQ
jgi:Flp pilus assembly protein CpaB